MREDFVKCYCNECFGVVEQLSDTSFRCMDCESILKNEDLLSTNDIKLIALKNYKVTKSESTPHKPIEVLRDNQYQIRRMEDALNLVYMTVEESAVVWKEWSESKKIMRANS